VDAILAVITTFVPDYWLVELLAQCDRPVFLWCVEREMQCLALVCGPLITATLYNLSRRYRLAGADTGDAATWAELRSFARAAMLDRLLRTLRVGYVGGPCPIMCSMAVDEYALRRLGTTVVNLPIEEFYAAAKEVDDAAVARAWQQVRASVGRVTAAEADGLRSTRYHLAARWLVEQHGLQALSLNCFPHLKSQVCLAVSKLNDEGVAAACEGDLHSTILMHLLQQLAGRPAFNGDWLRMCPATNEALFSHCGGGAFALAARPQDVCLQCSMETRDGLAVCYATKLTGPVTLLNLMVGGGRLRLAALRGEAADTDLEYEGTPLKVRFPGDVREVLQRMARCGAGHHWNGAAGDWTGEFERLCEWKDIQWSRI
jgi:L-fucose isomerase-like protein